MNYADLVNVFAANPHDVHTVPIQAWRQPVWFSVRAENGKLYVDNAESHLPSSRISCPRVLAPGQFERVLEIYHRRKKLEAVSREAGGATANQVYWYGIFAEMGL